MGKVSFLFLIMLFLLSIQSIAQQQTLRVLEEDFSFSCPGGSNSIGDCEVVSIGGQAEGDIRHISTFTVPKFNLPGFVLERVKCNFQFSADGIVDIEVNTPGPFTVNEGQGQAIYQAINNIEGIVGNPGILCFQTIQKPIPAFSGTGISNFSFPIFFNGLTSRNYGAGSTQAQNFLGEGTVDVSIENLQRFYYTDTIGDNVLDIDASLSQSGSVTLSLDYIYSPAQRPFITEFENIKFKDPDTGVDLKVVQGDSPFVNTQINLAGKRLRANTTFRVGHTDPDSLSDEQKNQDVIVKLLLTNSEGVEVELTGPNITVGSNVISNGGRVLGKLGALIEDSDEPIALRFSHTPNRVDFLDYKIVIDPDGQVFGEPIELTELLINRVEFDLEVVQQSIKLYQIIDEFKLTEFGKPDLELTDMIKGRRVGVKAFLKFNQLNPSTFEIPQGFRARVPSVKLEFLDDLSAEPVTPYAEILRDSEGNESDKPFEGTNILNYQKIIDAGTIGLPVRFVSPNTSLDFAESDRLVTKLRVTIENLSSGSNQILFREPQNIDLEPISEPSNNKDVRTFMVHHTNNMALQYIPLTNTLESTNAHPSQALLNDVLLLAEQEIRERFPISNSSNSGLIQSSEDAIEALFLDEWSEAPNMSYTLPDGSRIIVERNASISRELARLADESHQGTDRVIGAVLPGYFSDRIRIVNPNSSAKKPTIKGIATGKLNTRGIKVGNARSLIVVFNSSNKADSAETITHELGHSLGADVFGHTSSNTTQTNFSAYRLQNLISHTGMHSRGIDFRNNYILKEEFDSLVQTFKTEKLDPQLIVVTGILGVEGDVEILSTKILESGFETNSDPEGNFQIDLVSPETGQVNSVNIIPSFEEAIEIELDGVDISAKGETEEAIFSVAIPYEGGPVSVQISLDEQPILEYEPLGESLATIVSNLSNEVFKRERFVRVKRKVLEKSVQVLCKLIEKERYRAAKFQIRVFRKLIETILKSEIEVSRFESNKEDVLTALDQIEENLGL